MNKKLAHNSAASQSGLGVFSLAMISIIAVCNLRSLSFAAMLGPSLVGYYIIASMFFLLPIALITVSFSAHFPANGGIYGWIKIAFGGQVGLLAVWLQWIYNLIWYPTQLIFITSLALSLFFPELRASPWITFIVSLIFFSSFTALHFLGIHAASWSMNIAAIIGTLLPLCFFSGITLQSMPQNIGQYIYNTQWLPAFDTDHFVYLSGVTFGLMGIEICGFYAENVENPRYVYPRALSLAGVVIILGMILSSLAIVHSVAGQDLDILTAMVQTLDVFFSINHYYLREVVGVLILIGSSATVFAWLLGPSKGIVAAAKDGSAPAFFAQENAYGAPVAVLKVQWIIFFVLSFSHCFIQMDVLYLYFSVITTQLALMVYILFIMAFLTMRHKMRPDMPILYGGQVFLVCMSLAYCFFIILCGFIVPECNLGLSPSTYAMSMLCGMMMCILLPLRMMKYDTRYRD